MGLGDEIMALGCVETAFEKTGKVHSIKCAIGTKRTHKIWNGNPAYDPATHTHIVDGGGFRPYIKAWKNRQAIYNLDYKARAGKIYFDNSYRDNCPLVGPYAVIEPNIKLGASPNKNWGMKRWAEVIKDFPIPVYQLVQDHKEKVVDGAIAHHTPDLYDALAAIERAALVLCNEGGTHHMAASMDTPAVVIFGSFVPPQVTGYDLHTNIAVETEHGYCGKWGKCTVCQETLEGIKPNYVREKAIKLLEKVNEN